MANLSKLLEDRNRARRRGIEKTKGGDVFYHTFQDTHSGRCQFCWRSPGVGLAVIELWGASGSGARQCCCTQAGVPANSAAYSRKLVPVCATSYVCGWLGCSVQSTGALCYAGRSQCSVACIFLSGGNGTMAAQGGYGGFTNCTTSTGQFLCLRCSCNFCNTPIGGTGCGIVCNIGGPNGAVQATASGGDTNVPGGISCSRMWCCLNCGHQSAPQQTLALSAGLFSDAAPTCIMYTRNPGNYNTGSQQADNGRAEIDIALSSLGGSMPMSMRCWTSNSTCGCYEYTGCMYGAVGVPGSNGIPCGNVRSEGQRGGHGAVKITFYT